MGRLGMGKYYPKGSMSWRIVRFVRPERREDEVFERRTLRAFFDMQSIYAGKNGHMRINFNIELFLIILEKK